MLLTIDPITTITIEDKVIIITMVIEDRTLEATIIRPIATIVDRPDTWLGIAL